MMLQDQQATGTAYYKSGSDTGSSDGKTYRLSFKTGKPSLWDWERTSHSAGPKPSTHLILSFGSVETWLAAAQDYYKLSDKVAIRGLLSNDGLLETKTCHRAEHLGSPCMVRLAWQSTQPCTILSLCSVVLSFHGDSWPCHNLSRRMYSPPTSSTGLMRTENRMKAGDEGSLLCSFKEEPPETYSITHWKWKHCYLMSNRSSSLFRWCFSLICYDMTSARGKFGYSNAAI